MFFPSYLDALVFICLDNELLIYIKNIISGWLLLIRNKFYSSILKLKTNIEKKNMPLKKKKLKTVQFLKEICSENAFEDFNNTPFSVSSKTAQNKRTVNCWYCFVKDILDQQIDQPISISTKVSPYIFYFPVRYK